MANAMIYLEEADKITIGEGASITGSILTIISLKANLTMLDILELESAHFCANGRLVSEAESPASEDETLYVYYLASDLFSDEFIKLFTEIPTDTFIVINQTISGIGHVYDYDCDTTCSVCNDVRTDGEAHTYDYGCDAECNVCGETRVTDHTYDNACDETCNYNCGEIREVENHVYDNACDTTCNTCNA